MQKVYPVSYITRSDQDAMDAGMVKGQLGWCTPENFLHRVEAELEKPVTYLTTYRTIISQLCGYVCQFWNEVLYTPEVSMEEKQLESMRIKQAYLQSLDGGSHV